ncbi:Proton_antipo_M domain-containing protein [Caenorhabditis elegans]|uniref:Proton_antipo_M domain-containing protein n=1 Tax=Caenorhabditis elegans TaxID=6239 RepID=Q22131_CAEEL|nr:Proton_antipo_M domain-containing protein [Caenorhabditis elegans]CCD73948.1 Proton_antipo_M domain-containing protein [Caenorhabditis elegans]|eukprot:NP_498668.1 Uncharacterized protein CELE_T04A6.2 [Caenorhabditis elegans]
MPILNRIMNFLKLLNMFWPINFNREEYRIVTQKPFRRNRNPISLITHLVLALTITGLQLHYELFQGGELKELAFIFMTTGNAISFLSGSVRGFDMILLIELLTAAATAYIYDMTLYYPVIMLMMAQTYIRLENTIELPEIDEDDIHHENHPENWRNNMHSRNERD